MTKQEAYKEIADNIAAAYELINKSETLANEYDVEFSLDLAYGMGGWYRPIPKDADPNELDDDYRKKYGWLASSHDC